LVQYIGNTIELVGYRFLNVGCWLGGALKRADGALASGRSCMV
jgi:hypothetical protein